MSTKTLTVLFTDLAGYTASVGRSDRQAIRDLIASHEAEVAAVLESSGGRVVKSLGDSFMALFESATDAVRAAIRLLESLKSSAKFKVRVGIATGDVEQISNDYFGDAVNLASRIISESQVEQIWFSESTFLAMNQAEIAWEIVGLFRFKGFYGDLRVYRAVPAEQVFLPKPIEDAIEHSDLIVVKSDVSLPRVNHDSVLLLLDCPTGGDELENVLGKLPVIHSKQVWLCGYTIPPVDRWNWTQRGSGWVIGKTEIIEQLVEEKQKQRKLASSSMTLFFESTREVEAGIAAVGMALPRTPLSEVILSYTYDLNEEGDWVNFSSQSLLRIEVTTSAVSLLILNSAVLYNDQVRPIGANITLEHNDRIMTPFGELVFTIFSAGPYIGLVLGGKASLFPIETNSTVEIGREPRADGFALHDRKGQKNLRWCSGPRAKKARQSGFTLDRALAGRRQAQFISTNGGFLLCHLHEHCPTYIVSNDSLIPVSQERHLNFDELVVTGTSVLTLRQPSVST